MSSKSASPANGAGISAEPFVFAPASGERTEPFGAGAVRAMTPSASDRRSRTEGVREGTGRGRSAGACFLRTISDELARRDFRNAAPIRRYSGKATSSGSRREVVQLALSIARKILHREAQIDPLLLTGDCPRGPGHPE